MNDERTFDPDDRQAFQEEFLQEGMHFGKRPHRRIMQSTMEALSYDANMPVSPRDPATEWRSIVEEECQFIPSPPVVDEKLFEVLRAAFPGQPAAAVLLGVSLFVTLTGYRVGDGRRTG